MCDYECPFTHARRHPIMCRVHQGNGPCGRDAQGCRNVATTRGWQESAYNTHSSPPGITNWTQNRTRVLPSTVRARGASARPCAARTRYLVHARLPPHTASRANGACPGERVRLCVQTSWMPETAGVTCTKYPKSNCRRCWRYDDDCAGRQAARARIRVSRGPAGGSRQPAAGPDGYASPSLP